MPDPIRIVVDHQGKDRTEENEFTSLSTKLMPDKGPWFKDMERVRQELIPDMLEKSRNIARSRTRTMIQQAKTRIEKTLGREIFRLIQLKQINPDIREAEIGLARDRMDALLDHLSSSRIRMDAIRLIRVQ
jgi:ATP-dependent helicase HepA